MNAVEAPQKRHKSATKANERDGSATKSATEANDRDGSTTEASERHKNAR